MPETHKGPTAKVGEEMLDPKKVSQNRTPGTSQGHPGGDPDDQQGLSQGVTQGHADPQQAKHGNSGEATSRSSTGLPQPQQDKNEAGNPNSGTRSERQ